MRRLVHFSKHKFEESASPSTSTRRSPSLCAKIKARSQALASTTKASATLLTSESTGG
ncbi:hypothetical protein ES288_D08G206600v1 [Gossypium darwinii]|uniref:Uncharacterized protein n=2 Tax=Gossypium TaxID=3633 RepID=A0A5D2JWU4_GOSTO|nr:hypothetical protein ES288_D08G206600v1 [Gossypium darwinii]TYH59124.1 hypothetical protein ES332_D08G202300v1 [Gossypium tomentosum]